LYVVSKALIGIEAVRKLNVSEDNPLPGHPLLVVETQWRCHYLGFVNASERQKFFEKLNQAIFSHSCGGGRLGVSYAYVDLIGFEIAAVLIN
jgi:hypothetical protein